MDASDDTNILTAQLETPSITPETITTDSRPKKRGRQFLNCVEVPSVASIYGKRNIVSKPVTEPKQEYDKKLGKLLNVCIFCHFWGIQLTVLIYPAQGQASEKFCLECRYCSGTPR